MAHILNIIVNDGLKYQNCHVECIQKAVRYIRMSPQRISKFMKAFLCGDTPTRWKSTFMLLKSAYQLREAFMEFGVRDYNSEFYVSLTYKSYERDLGRVPENYEFEIVMEIVKFFEKFKTKTELVSATSKPLVNLFIREVLDVDIHLRKWSTKPMFLKMVKDMKTKYDKHWGICNKMNDFRYFMVLLDLTSESPFLLHAFKKMIGYMEPSLTPMGIDIKARQMVREVENRMENLFMSYLERFDNASQIVIDVDDDNDFFGDFLCTGGSNSDPIDKELRTYLKENIVNYKKDFSILGWWRVNVIRFPTVARMAKDILAIQISSMASESAFSTCGRVVSEYQTSLSTLIVEALLCNQDWVRKSINLIIDNIDDT
uniref:HAT C-terminal dimerisation domain-containing protein n=1 Tax=Lactuca sativa TaxID=4236 RepID=A0A9R1ULB3_LACSA|nr:hypothetical protein LSAT_V11C800452830 [Lactuca sativa]